MVRFVVSNRVRTFVAGNGGKVASFVFAFGLMGALLLTFSHAATPTASLEAEGGTVGGNASVFADTTASGGQGIKFGTASQSLTCNLNATTANFSAQISAATAGQVICLASGSFGTFSGTNKAVTIAAASGASVAMDISFSSGDSSFTIDGSGVGGSMSIAGGSIGSSANHITVKDAVFTSQLSISVSGGNSAILLDHDTFNNQSTVDCKELPARINITNTASPSDVTVSNSLLSGGDLDGIRPDSPNGSTIINNEFVNVANTTDSCQHTDPIQMYGGQNNIIRGNYIHDSDDGIVAFDGTANNQITDNACANLVRTSCVTLYSDTNSVVEHNSGGPGMRALELDAKSGDPTGTGTVFKDNVGSVSTGDGSTMAVNTNNLFSGASSPNISGSPTFVGGTTPTTWAGFKLASGSPGIGAASDGTNVGIN